MTYHIILFFFVTFTKLICIEIEIFKMHVCSSLARHEPGTYRIKMDHSATGTIGVQYSQFDTVYCLCVSVQLISILDGFSTPVRG